MGRFIQFIIVILVITCHLGNSQWSQPYHDNWHSSYSQSSYPIANNMVWSYNNTLSTNINNNTSSSNIIYNPVILQDQSYIVLNNVNSMIYVNRLDYSSDTIFSIPLNKSDTQESIEISMLLLGVQESSIVNTTLIIYNHYNGNLNALNASNGNIIWSTVVNGKCDSYLQYINNTVILLCVDSIQQFNQSTGDLMNNIQLLNTNNNNTISTLLDGGGNLWVYINYDNNEFQVWNNTNSSWIDNSHRYNSSYSLMSSHDGRIPTSSVYSTNFNNATKGTISNLVCVNDTILQLENRLIVNGTLLFSQELVTDEPCENILVPRLSMISGSTVYVSFSIIDDDGDNDDNTTISTYLMSVNIYSNTIQMLVKNQKYLILDLSISSNLNIYLCTRDHGVILLDGQSGKQITSIEYGTMLNSPANYCSLGIGKASANLLLFNTSATMLRVTDSLCTDVCDQNFVCTTTNCQCGPNYYPAGVCSTYCDPDSTCNGYGTCTDEGECVCDPTTGWIGPNCDVCKKGYFGGQCNFHIAWNAIIIGGVIAILATSSICIFSCVTRPKDAKPICYKPVKLVKRCFGIPLKKSIPKSSTTYSPGLTSISYSPSQSSRYTRLQEENESLILNDDGNL